MQISLYRLQWPLTIMIFTASARTKSSPACQVLYTHGHEHTLEHGLSHLQVAGAEMQRSIWRRTQHLKHQVKILLCFKTLELIAIYN